MTGSDCDKANDAVDARRAPTFGPLSNCCVPEIGGYPWEANTGGLPARVIELMPSEVPGLGPCFVGTPGRVSVVCFAVVPRFDETGNPRLVDGLDTGGC